MKPHVTKLTELKACPEAVKFAEQFNSIEETLKNTERGDWILWLADKLQVDKRKLTLAKALCVETVIHLIKDKRSKKAVEVAKRYGEGEATEKELKIVATAAADVVAVADDADAAANAAVAAVAAAATVVAAATNVAVAAAATNVAVAAAATVAAAADAVAVAVADAADAADAAQRENQRKTAKISKEILFNEIIGKFYSL